MSDNGRLDSNQEILLLAIILQNDGVCVINLTVSPTVGSEEPRH